MGRYYGGDIEGKFWFGVQSSDVGESFGAVEQEPYEIEYVIYREYLDTTHKRMAELEKHMGEFKQKLEIFFEKNISYNDAKLIDEGIDPKYVPYFADWFFGKKILDFFEQHPNADECCFTAEL
jgi:hypothetical protein